MEIGDYGYYYPVNWVNGMPKVDDERWGKKCRIVNMHERLLFVVFEGMQGVTYATVSEVKEKEVKTNDKHKHR